MSSRSNQLWPTRLFQTSRLCFRRSIEERIDELHQQMRDGKVGITNGRLPAAALRVLEGR